MRTTQVFCQLDQSASNIKPNLAMTLDLLAKHRYTILGYRDGHSVKLANGQDGSMYPSSSWLKF